MRYSIQSSQNSREFCRQSEALLPHQMWLCCGLCSLWIYAVYGIPFCLYHFSVASLSISVSIQLTFFYIKKLYSFVSVSVCPKIFDQQANVSLTVKRKSKRYNVCERELIFACALWSAHSLRVCVCAFRSRLPSMY